MGIKKRSFFVPAAPTTSNRLQPVGAAPSKEAVGAAPEGAIAHTRTETPAKTAENSPRIGVCISSMCTVNVIIFPSYSVTCNANPAEQGRRKHGSHDCFQKPAFCREISSFHSKLGENNPGRVGIAHNSGFQDRIPSKTQTKPQASSNYLHKEGRGMHAGRDPQHANRQYREHRTI